MKTGWITMEELTETRGNSEMTWGACAEIQGNPLITWEEWAKLPENSERPLGGENWTEFMGRIYVRVEGGYICMEDVDQLDSEHDGKCHFCGIVDPQSGGSMFYAIPDGELEEDATILAAACPACKECVEKSLPDLGASMDKDTLMQHLYTLENSLSGNPAKFVCGSWDCAHRTQLDSSS